MLPMQLTQVPGDIGRSYIPLLNAEPGSQQAPPGGQTEAADDAEAVVTRRDDLLGSRPDGSPSAAVERLQPKAAFIEKHEGCVTLTRFF